MGDVVIRADNLSKQYLIGAKLDGHKTLRETMTSGFVTPFRRMMKLLQGQAPSAAEMREKIWALKDASFEIRRGEVVGIIGPNGAGKTTLLKILSRITEPTDGYAEIHGRVGSLLEVGTGFHPELTGRENIYLNGAILGMKKAEIVSKFDEIVDFAEIDKFIDTPVKHYSSGMYVRLAFAVAAHLEPEILLVDEVLAVGDVAFQKKCLGKIGDFAGGGRTVLFVSHNMGAVRILCDRCFMTTGGQIVEDGNPDMVVDNYLSDLSKRTMSGSITWELEEAPGTEAFRLRKIELLGNSGKVQSAFVPQELVEICIGYQLLQPVSGMRVVLQVLAPTGEIAFTSTDHSIRSGETSAPGSYFSSCRIPGGLLNLGEYMVKVWAGIPGIGRLLKPDTFIKFLVTGEGNHGSWFIDYKKWPGVVCPKLEWRVGRRKPNK
jgi:lipopolysaccharide transport system ATP-binding protein